MAIVPLATLLIWAGGDLNLAVLTDSYIWRVLRFTLWQSFLSAVISLLLAIPVARALSRRPSRGADWLLRFSLVSFCLPVIVATFAMIQSYGSQGPLAWLANMLGLDWPPIFGLFGILITHVFFNWPLATLLIYRQLQSVPNSHWRLAAQWRLSRSMVWNKIEWPAIRLVLPATFSLIMGLCFTSFAVVLTLGGGPAATTLEVAVYQAITSAFDYQAAALLALLQLLVCGAILLLGQYLSLGDALTGKSLPNIQRFDRQYWAAKILDWGCITIYTLFLLGPLFVLVISAMDQGWPTHWGAIAKATLSSWMVALSAGSLAMVFALGLLLGMREFGLRQGSAKLAAVMELPAYVIFLYPSLVLATGLFLVLRPMMQYSWVAPMAVILVNTLLVLPFALRVLRAPVYQVAQRHDKLAASVNLTGFRRAKLLEWPLLRTDIGYALSICCTLALGDMGAIALFGTGDFKTLPWLLYQSLGSYRFGEAHWVALILLLQCGLCYSTIRYLIGNNDADA